MAATSNHYGDIANWIEKVIDSCNHPKQQATAQRLINNFEKYLLRSNVDTNVYTELSRRLNLKLYSL